MGEAPATTTDRKPRSRSESECFMQGRASLMKRLRGSLPLPHQLMKVAETPVPDDYFDYLSPISVHQIIKVVKEASTGRLLAAKVTDIEEEAIGKMAVKEYKTLMMIDHTNVIHPSHLLIDLQSNKAYMFMPILSESTLSDALAARPSPFPESEVRLIAKQLMSALRCIHELKIAHRDVNPNNVMYADGKVVLIDFQTCAQLTPGKWMMSSVGTGAFKAPEMKTSNTYTYLLRSERIDVWSASAVFATLLHKDPKDFQSPMFHDGLTPACANFLEKGLEVDPENRMTAEEAEKHEWLA